MAPAPYRRSSGITPSRVAANTRLAARLTRALHREIVQDALYDRLRGLVADQMLAEVPRTDRPVLDGTPFTLEFEGELWQVEVQDVAGLVNIYTAPPALLRAVLLNAEAVERTRSDWTQAGLRYAALEMTLAQLGVPPEATAMFTQSGAATRLRVENSPAALRERLGELPPALIMGGQVQGVRMNAWQHH